MIVQFRIRIQHDHKYPRSDIGSTGKTPNRTQLLFLNFPFQIQLAVQVRAAPAQWPPQWSMPAATYPYLSYTQSSGTQSAQQQQQYSGTSVNVFGGPPAFPNTGIPPISANAKAAFNAMPSFGSSFNSRFNQIPSRIGETITTGTTSIQPGFTSSFAQVAPIVSPSNGDRRIESMFDKDTGSNFNLPPYLLPTFGGPFTYTHTSDRGSYSSNSQTNTNSIGLSASPGVLPGNNLTGLNLSSSNTKQNFSGTRDLNSVSMSGTGRK